MRRATVGFILILALLAAGSAKPNHTTPAHHTGLVVDTACAFAFDVPPGISVEHRPNFHEYLFGRADSGLFTLECDGFPDSSGVRARRMRAPDSILPALPDLRDSSLVDAELYGCNGAGGGEDFSADSVLQVSRYQTRVGLPVLELTYRVHDRFYAAELDSPDPYQRDTTYTAGPSLLVDIGGGRLVRLTSGDCRERMTPTTLRIARTVVRSIRQSAAH